MYIYIDICVCDEVKPRARLAPVTTVRRTGAGGGSRKSGYISPVAAVAA